MCEEKKRIKYIIDAIRSSGLDETLKTQLINRLNKGIPALEAAINRHIVSITSVAKARHTRRTNQDDNNEINEDN